VIPPGRSGEGYSTFSAAASERNSDWSQDAVVPDGACSLSPHISQDSCETEPTPALQNGQHRSNRERRPFPRLIISDLRFDP